MQPVEIDCSTGRLGHSTSTLNPKQLYDNSRNDDSGKVDIGYDDIGNDDFKFKLDMSLIKLTDLLCSKDFSLDPLYFLQSAVLWEELFL